MTWFLMSDFDETFTEASDGCSLLSQKLPMDVHSNLKPSAGSSGMTHKKELKGKYHTSPIYKTKYRNVHLTTDWFLTWFLMSDLDETYTDTSDGCSLPSDTIYSSFQKKSNDTNCRCNLQLKQFMHQLNIKVGVLGL